MKTFDPESIHLAVPTRQGKNVKASDLVVEAAYKYNMLRKNLDPDQTIDLTCCIGGNRYPVAKISPYSEECLYIVPRQQNLWVDPGSGSRPNV